MLQDTLMPAHQYCSPMVKGEPDMGCPFGGEGISFPACGAFTKIDAAVIVWSGLEKMNAPKVRSSPP